MFDRQNEEPPSVGPWGASQPSRRGWRDRIPRRVRAKLIGPDGAIQRTSRLLLNVALITGSAVIIPPLIGASTVLTLSMIAFACAALLGYLSVLHDFIEGRRPSPSARRRKKAIWLAAVIWMIGILVIAWFILPSPQ